MEPRGTPLKNKEAIRATITHQTAVGESQKIASVGLLLE
jgi:hypothetical protein